MLVPQSLTMTEKVYGVIENSDVAQLRKFITYNIRSALHANRWKTFRDTTQIQVTLKNKINKGINETVVLQYHLPKMQQIILGSLTETELQTFPLYD